MSDAAPSESAPESTTVEKVEPTAAETKVYDEAYVKELRQEAAASRVAKKDAVEAAVRELKDAHQAELANRDTAYTELQNNLGSAWVELEKIKTSIEAKVPSDKVLQFVSILQGNDKDSIQESAKSALKLFGGFDNKSPAFDPTQGSGGRKDIPLNGDPILAAITKAVGIKH